MKLVKSVKGTPEKKKARRAEKAALALLPFSKLKEDMQEEIVAVIDSKTREYLRLTDPAAFMARLRKEGKEEDAVALESVHSITTMDES